MCNLGYNSFTFTPIKKNMKIPNLKCYVKNLFKIIINFQYSGTPCTFQVQLFIYTLTFYHNLNSISRENVYQVCISFFLL